jgi:hypothetical protein
MRILAPADFFQNFGGVAFRRRFIPYVLNFPLGINPVGHSDNSEKRFPKETFHSARAVGFDHFELRVGEQREIQIVFLFEFCLALDGIGAASQNHSVQFVELLLRVAKLGRFVGSTGGHGLREEIQHNIFPVEIPEGDLSSVVRFYFEVRRSFANFKYFAHASLRSISVAAI